ncbi:hypothetical protein CMI37_06045 [Candidatus Pacearchaeota archaeon]|nr:hypothetical protein [Candidatus Pacearchaeota archaeon]
MAIQKAHTDDYGATHSSAYHRVLSVTFQQQEGDTVENAVIRIGIYSSASARSKGTAADEKLTLKVNSYSLSGSAYTTYFGTDLLSGDTTTATVIPETTVLDQAYVYLKTQTSPINYTTGTTDV